MQLTGSRIRVNSLSFMGTSKKWNYNVMCWPASNIWKSFKKKLIYSIDVNFWREKLTAVFPLNAIYKQQWLYCYVAVSFQTRRETRKENKSLKPGWRGEWNFKEKSCHTDHFWGGSNLHFSKPYELTNFTSLGYFTFSWTTKQQALATQTYKMKWL